MLKDHIRSVLSIPSFQSIIPEHHSVPFRSLPFHSLPFHSILSCYSIPFHFPSFHVLEKAPKRPSKNTLHSPVKAVGWFHSVAPRWKTDIFHRFPEESDSSDFFVSKFKSLFTIVFHVSSSKGLQILKNIAGTIIDELVIWEPTAYISDTFFSEMIIDLHGTCIFKFKS